VKLSAWRVALRIARRDALRAKGRSALVIAMIAVPILGVTAADVTYRSAHLTVQQSADRQMGTAAADVTVEDQGAPIEQSPDLSGIMDAPGKETAQQKARAKEPVDQLLREALPTGARLTPVGSALYLEASTAYGQSTVALQGLDLSDPALHGLVTLRQGRLPSAPYQVAATSSFLSDSGLRIGDTTTLRGSSHPLTITAVVEFPNDLKTERVVARPADVAVLSAELSTGGVTPSGFGPSDWLVSLPGGAPFSWDDVVRANQYGFTVTSRAVLADPPPNSAVPYLRSANLGDSGGPTTSTVTVAVTVVGMALLEIVLLAGPAFAVGARRSRRQLGLLAATGGDRAHVRAVVLGGGVVLGTVGAAIGMVVGAVAVAIARSPLENFVGARFGSFALQPLDLLGIVAVGLVTGLLAAVVPAVQASRQSVVASLSGRGIVKPASMWLTALGVVAVAGGTVLAMLGFGSQDRTSAITAGSMIAELGVVACTPFLVGLFGKLGRWLPLGPRLALRDSTRHRGRTAPAVAAVMAAVAGAVAVVAFQGSSQAEDRAAYLSSAPTNAVVLTAGFNGPGDTGTLPQQAAAVQRSIAGLGPRGDFSTVAVPGADCLGSHACSEFATIELPADQVCPAYATDAQGKPVRNYSAAEIKALTRTDPRCRTEQGDGGGYFSSTSVAVGDATVLRNLVGVTDPAAVAALAQGKVLVRSPRLIENGRVTLSIDVDPGQESQGGSSSTRTFTAPGFAISTDVGTFSALMSPETARTMGLALEPGGSAWLPKQMPSSAEEQRAAAAVSDVGGGSVAVERGYQNDTTAIEFGLVAAAALVAIAAAGIATGLAAADSQADLATLAAVGAAPRIRRTLSGFQCAVIAVMGALLGSAAGLVPAEALWRVHVGQRGQPGYNFNTGVIDVLPGSVVSVPWGTMALVVVGLPLMAWLLAAGFTRSRVVLTRRAG
jgi:putative ABC transport system permease protein